MYLQVGAMLGTMMVGNVFFVIIPAHWELVRAKQAGREPDPAANARGKLRSVHNNYLTLPVVFTMLSNHFPFTYGHSYSWLILVVLLVIGAWVRHFSIAALEEPWGVPVNAAIAIPCSRSDPPPERGGKPGKDGAVQQVARVSSSVAAPHCQTGGRRWPRAARDQARNAEEIKAQRWIEQQAVQTGDPIGNVPA